MADVTPVSALNRPGQVENAGDASALLLKVFAGEVLATFEESNVLMGITRTKTLSGGAVSWRFPVIGRASTSYHTPGDNILTDEDGQAAPAKYLKNIKQDERLIHADKLLTSSVFIDKLDTILNHFDARAEYARELGRALAVTVDKNLMRMLFKASQAAATITGLNGGFEILDADANTNGPSFVDALFRAKQKMDETDVPKDGRYAVISPAQMRLLFTDGAGAITSSLQWINRDFAGGGSTGEFGSGRVPSLAGFTLVESNHVLTATDASTDNQYAAGAANDYTYTHVPAELIVATVFQRDAVATVKLADLSVESEYMINYQGDLLVAKMCLGHGILRPECAGLIRLT